MNYRVGLSGGIGSGKSTVAALFQEQGIAVIDSDAISHRLTGAGGAAIPGIREAFGPEYISEQGALDRARMRGLVFSDIAAKQKLEALVHPLIRAEMLEQAQAATHSAYILLVVPLLFEAKNYRELVQRAVVVDCPEETQIARTMRRSGLTEGEVRAILAGQISRAERLKLADDVIRNDGSLDELRAQVVHLHRIYLDRSSEITFRLS
jgi:dephospho-CoA kinase